MSNSKTPRKRRAWPDKRRADQAQNIRKTTPWTRTTGPRTPEGKAASRQNAHKHGARSATFTALRKALKENQKRLDLADKND